MTQRVVKRFRTNRRGSDYVVGDIHGEFAKLETALAKLAFDKQRDRLFSVGDLVDRGPQSAQVRNWLGRRWFHAVLGNHEQMLIRLAGKQLDDWLATNGGEWWHRTDSTTRDEIIGALSQLPLAIEVMTGSGKVGIVHADVPSGLSWQDFLASLRSGEDHAVEYALWSRSRIHGADDSPVRGVAKVFCGHTPLSKPAVLGNVHLIDTGACFGGPLTIVPLDENAD